MPSDRRDDDFEIPYRQVVREGTKSIFSGAYLAVLVALIVAILSGVGWWLSVALSGPTGAAQQYKDQNSAANREAAQTKLVGDYNTIRADQANIKTQAASTRQIDKDSLAGTEQVCNSDVTQYDQDASSVLISPWIPSGWPKSIDEVATDQTSPCDPASTKLPVLTAG